MTFSYYHQLAAQDREHLNAVRCGHAIPASFEAGLVRRGLVTSMMGSCWLTDAGERRLRDLEEMS